MRRMPLGTMQSRKKCKDGWCRIHSRTALRSSARGGLIKDLKAARSRTAIPSQCRITSCEASASEKFSLSPGESATSVRVLMRFFLTWLLVFGVLAGLNLRALSASGSSLTMCAEEISHCCGNDASQHQGQNHEGHECPLNDHHHHGCCFHVLTLILGTDAEWKFTLSSSSFAGFRHEGEIPPDGPFLGSEKPPLI